MRRNLSSKTSGGSIANTLCERIPILLPQRSMASLWTRNVRGRTRQSLSLRMCKASLISSTIACISLQAIHSTHPNPGSWQQMKDLYFNRLRSQRPRHVYRRSNRIHIMKNPETPQLAKEMIGYVNRYAEEAKFLGTYADSNRWSLMEDFDVSISRTESNVLRAGCHPQVCLMDKEVTCRTSLCEQGRCISAIQGWSSDTSIYPKQKLGLSAGVLVSLKWQAPVRESPYWMECMTATAHSQRYV